MATIDLKRRPRQEGPLTAQPVLEPAEERDPFEEQERVARAVGRSPIQEAALEVEEGHPGKPQRCKYCAASATHSLIHAEGRAYVPVCDAHDGRGRRGIGDDLDIVGVRRIAEADTTADFPVELALPAELERVRKKWAKLRKEKPELDEWALVCEALALEEGAHWDPEKHPRWPKGTPLTRT
jgi:hypothetical protein